MKAPKIFRGKSLSSSPSSNSNSPSGVSPENSRFTSSRSLTGSHKRSFFASKLLPCKSAPLLRSVPKQREVLDDDSPPSSIELGSSSDKSSEHSAEMEELCRVFRIFDTNGDGKISIDELGAVMNSLGDNPTEEDLKLMVKEADSDGDGYVDLEEFLKLNTTATLEKTMSEELKAAFRVFDANNDGLISAEELFGVLSRLGDKGLTMEACCKMIAGVDSNGDGYVSYEEFEKMMRF